MSLYDDVLNCPDTHCRKEALDKLCREKIAEGMEMAARIAINCWPSCADGHDIADAIRQAAKDLEDV